MNRPTGRDEMKQAAHVRRGIVLALLIFSLNAGLAQAFLFEITPLKKEAVLKLTDEKLIETYIDVMIELEAVDSFYNNTGFAPREYAKYKALLRFRTDLLMEIEKRELEVPRIK